MASKKKNDSGAAPKSAAKSRSAGTTSKARAGKPAPRARKDAPEAESPAAAAPQQARGAVGVSIPKAVRVEREIGGRKLSLETGRMARQADGAVVVRYGDTMVLATAQSQKAGDHIDFFPLTVDYREKTAAAGMIPGGFFKREGRPTTKEILGCRLIDRSVRPMFPDGYKAEVQVLSQVLATDRENDPDVVAAIASFAALALSSIPHGTTLGMCRIGLRDGKLMVNPLWSEIQSADNKLNLTVAGSKDAIVMVEAGAKEVTEEVMLEALELGHKTARQIAELIEELREKAGRTKMEFTPPKRDEKLVAAIEAQFGKQLRSAPLTPGSKQTRSAAIKAAKEAATSAFPAPAGSTDAEKVKWGKAVGEIVGGIVKEGERESILRGRRADGRDHTSIRPITIEVGVLPRVHGSVLFTRGETQALGVVTLGGVDDQQIIDGLMPEQKKRFLLHYNFPPFSVGEVKRTGSPGRREIGHGALAERGVEPVLPSREEFPYTIRITSEILESNGSSSMATACSATLAMMDAGVPIKQPVAGVAMGLVMEGRKYAILSDILGSEDACGDMDFKVVGTGRGITALQMDIKCDGLTREILREALEQARQGRLHVLREMLKVLREPRSQLSPNAPRLESVTIPQEKIGLVIGPAGKNIRAMQENFEVKISIEDGGLCTVTGVNAEKVMACVEHLKAMTAEVGVGQIYEGRVSAIKEFGAFVEILPGQEGLVHVSELSDTFIKSVTDVVRIGDSLKVKVIGIDDFGKIKLSRKAVLLAERGEAPAEGEAPARAPREERGPRGFREERAERGDRGGRGFREDRGDRGPREERGERAPREDRGDRGPREERGFREDRGDRGPREERGFREDRGDRGPREERGFREDRGDRGPREERGFREDRGDRGPREERGFREDRGDRGPREERGFREDRGDRGPREDRGFREDRGDRAPREERGPRRDRPAREEAAPQAGGREDRAPRGRGDRDGGRRGGREDRGGGLPMSEFDTTEQDLVEAPPAKGGQEVGDLEDAGDLLNRQDRGPSRGRDGGRRRRR